VTNIFFPLQRKKNLLGCQLLWCCIFCFFDKFSFWWSTKPW